MSRGTLFWTPCSCSLPTSPIPWSAERSQLTVRRGKNSATVPNGGPIQGKFGPFYELRMSHGLMLWQDSISKFLKDPDTDTISAGIFSGIAKRFDDGLRQLDYVFNVGKSSVYDYLKQCAVLLLNAVLVEETLRKKEPKNIDFAFPVLEHKVFYENILTCLSLNRVKEGTALEKSHPLFSIIASFPLWGIFNLHGDIELVEKKEIYAGLKEKFPLFNPMPGGQAIESYLNAMDDFPWEKLEFI